MVKRATNYIVFDGVSSADHDIYISGEYTFGSSSRDVETVSVPGRDGDLIYDKGRYKNVPIRYPACMAVQHGFDDHFAVVRNIYSSRADGYKRLEDTYHPDEFRLARFSGALEPSMYAWNNGAEFELAFDCKPQRFLKAGEIPITVGSLLTICNPEQQTAKPLIRVYGYGTVQIGAYSFEVLQHSEAYMDLDCELMDAFCGPVNLNNKIVLSSFPTLPPGDTRIITPATVQQVEITPRWWRL